jgi:hypothetical protein
VGKPSNLREHLNNQSLEIKNHIVNQYTAQRCLFKTQYTAIRHILSHARANHGIPTEVPLVTEQVTSQEGLTRWSSLERSFLGRVLEGFLVPSVQNL